MERKDNVWVVIIIEKICESDYQSIYRITDGVLLVVNKFEYMSFPNDKHPYIYRKGNKRIWKRYAEGCQTNLVELAIDYQDEYRNWFVPKGTVLYNCHPVQIVPKSQWDYQLKTTGTAFSGGRSEMLKLLSIIEDAISERGEQNGNEM